MKVEFYNKKVKRQCEDPSLREFDKKEVAKINDIIKILMYADFLADIPIHQMKCHLLSGQRKGQFAIDIPSLGGGRGSKRLILVPYQDSYGKTNPKEISSICIIEIINYH